VEQNFNSSYAQREACEAFIKSQASEGWRLVKTHYDDGEVSDASMERVALQYLLGHIRQGLIEVVVVYKVDRLTRTLTDFAKMVELFDVHHVSFVAVTQHFNTATSMGRLTLNVLLSLSLAPQLMGAAKKGIRSRFLSAPRWLPPLDVMQMTARYKSQ
jgi:site-specific DNA recombinase